MDAGTVQVYYGNGRGKTSAALGYVIHEAGRGKSAIVIQFLKNKNDDELTFVGRLEPEIRLFRFQKSDKFFDELDKEAQEDEIRNMKNGIGYARKVLVTGECDTLILDEVLGLVDRGILSDEELISLIQARSYGMNLILTGRVISSQAIECVDYAYEIRTQKGAAQ